MAGSVRMSVEGLDQLNISFGKKAAEINRAASEGLKSIGMTILADAKENIRKNGSNNTAKLIDSGITQENKDGTIDVIFKSKYAYFVEFGRRAGKRPPLDQITEWVVKKGLADRFSIKTQKRIKRDKGFDYRALGIATLIANKIGKKGTTPKPFLYPALRANEESVMREIKQAINKVV